MRRRILGFPPTVDRASFVALERAFHARLDGGVRFSIERVVAQDDAVAITLRSAATLKDGRPYGSESAVFHGVLDGRIAWVHSSSTCSTLPRRSVSEAAMTDR